MRLRARSSGNELAPSDSHSIVEDETDAGPTISGGDIKEATPDPIPNSEVKLLGADGTARET